MNVSIRDFQPINNWKPDLNGELWSGEELEPMFIVDQTTNKKYLNESEGVVRVKCILLTLGTPFVHLFAAIYNVGVRVFKLLTCSHFQVENRKTLFAKKLADAGLDLLRIIATPLSLIGLELAALYGIFRPYDGRKLYASIERATYGSYILAPCFQPEPESHAFGGNINKKNAF